eukprot:Amastigsp_a182937_12.p2 type:complete len:116 gc:universal Amastigsp_a182937_12:776-429(-)
MAAPATEPESSLFSQEIESLDRPGHREVGAQAVWTLSTAKTGSVLLLTWRHGRAHKLDARFVLGCLDDGAQIWGRQSSRRQSGHVLAIRRRTTASHQHSVPAQDRPLRASALRRL